MSAQEIILFESSDGAVTLPVEVDSKTVWLNAEHMFSLFDREISVIRRHVRNVFNEKELVEGNNVRFLHVAGSLKPVAFYSLCVIISVGYRAKSQRGVEFRRWATHALRRSPRKPIARPPSTIDHRGTCCRNNHDCREPSSK